MWGKVYDHTHHPGAFLEHSTNSSSAQTVDKINQKITFGSECYNIRVECYNIRIRMLFSKSDLVTKNTSVIF